MLMCKQAEQCVPLQAEQSDLLADTDEDIDEQELEAHYSYMAKIQEVPTADSGTNSESLEQNDSLAFVHEYKQEMHADLKYVESLKKEIDDLKPDVMCTYLHSLSDLDAHTELQYLYLYKVKECNYLAQKLSKQTESISKEVYTELI
nr:hypothetical protein [Tanacetum cinerariifolium]